jgi:peptidoglycan/LPS O-acetylase OafA/YrhL
MTLLAPQMRSGRPLPLFCIAGGIVAAHLAVAWGLFGLAMPNGPGFWQASSYESLFLMFMFIGVLFSFHHRRQLSTPWLLAGVATLFIAFSVCWPLSSIGSQFPVAWLNYGYAFVLFSALYCLRSYARAFFPLDFLASISFPLYLVHATVGFALLKWLMIGWHWNYTSAVMVTFASVVLLATLLHMTVERRTMALGRRLAKK